MESPRSSADGIVPSAADDPLGELKALLRRLKTLRRLTSSGLESAAGLGHVTVSQALNGKIVPSEATITILARVLRADGESSIYADTRHLLELRRRAEALGSLAKAKNIGPPVHGIYIWDDWDDLERSRAIGSVWQPADDLEGDKPLISRETDELLHYRCLAWLEDADAPAQLTVVQGKHGAGRSTTLESVARRLAEQGHSHRLLIVHRPLGIADVDLTEISKSSRPCLFIDDADEADALGPVLRAYHAGGVHIVMSASSAHFADEVAFASRRNEYELIELPMLPEPDEIRDILALLRPVGKVSKAEKRQIRQSSLRGVIKALTDDDAQTAEVSSRLYALWQHTDLQDWFAPMLLTTARKIPIPRSILLASRRSAAVPREVDPWIRHVEETGDHLLWIEDPQTAAHTLVRIAAAMGSVAFEDYVVKTAVALLQNVQPERALDRRFARSLFRMLRKSQRTTVASQVHDVLDRTVEKDTLPNVAFCWLPLLVSAGRSPSAMSPRYRDLLSRPPQDAVELSIVLHVLGAAEVADALEEMLEGAAAWPTELWSRFLDMLRVAPEHHRRWVTRSALPLLRGAACDVPNLLRLTKSLRILAECVEAFAEPQDRRWLREHLTEIVQRTTEPARHRSEAARHTETLTDRCIGQDRSNLALQALGSYLREGVSISGVAIVDRYQQLLETECNEALGELAIDDLRSFATEMTDPALMRAAWRSVLALARHWQPTKLPYLVQDVVGALRVMHEHGVPPSANLELSLSAGRCIAQARCLTQADARFLLQPFSRERTTPWSGQLFLTVVGATAASTVPPAHEARRLLAALLDEDRRTLRKTVKRFTAAITDWTGLPFECQAPTPVISLDPYHHKRVVGELLPFLRLAACPDAGRRARELVRRFGGNGELEGMLITEILRIAQPSFALDLAYRGPAETTASRHLMRATVEALRDRIESAESQMRAAHRLYERDSKGAHPVWVRKAACGLLTRCGGERAVYLRVAAQVMSRAPLLPAEAVLQRSWAVTFEPDFLPIIGGVAVDSTPS